MRKSRPVPYNDLRALARNAEHLKKVAAAAPDDPEAAIKVVVAALERAAKLNEVPGMLEFSLRHAWAVREVVAEDPLGVLRSGRLARACALAELRGPEDRTVWFLLLAWELFLGGQTQAGLALLEKNASGGVRLEGQHAEYAVQLLLYVLPYATFLVHGLARRILQAPDQQALVQLLLQAGRDADARRVADAIDVASYREHAVHLCMGHQVNEALTGPGQPLPGTKTADYSPTLPTLLAPSVARLREDPPFGPVLRDVVDALEAGGQSEAARRVAARLGDVPETGPQREEPFPDWDWTTFQQALDAARTADPTVYRSILVAGCRASFGLALGAVQDLPQAMRADALYDVAAIQMESGDRSGARETIAGALKADPSSMFDRGWRMLQTLAVHLVERGDEDGGRATLASSVAIVHQLPIGLARDEALAHTAQTYARLKQGARACELLAFLGANRVGLLVGVADALAEAGDAEAFKTLLTMCSVTEAGAWHVCRSLMCLYPTHLPGLAAVLLGLTS